MVVLVLMACSGGEQTPVGTTLDDGQVLIGGVRTSTLNLAGAFGEVGVPLSDIGMILPVEGRTLADSGGHVTVWLRNGSELKGRWAAPELEVGLSVGGREIGVTVPTDRLQALQLQASEDWPEDGLYRVRTSSGDDFLVDPKATRIVVDNELGRFDPFLSECRSVGPISDPTQDWRIELTTGTVLIGPLATKEIAFALPMGPGQITVPLDALVGLERGVWHEHDASDPEALADWEAIDAIGYAAEGSAVAAPRVDAPASVPARAPVQVQARPKLRAKPGLSAEQGWFHNASMETAKH